MTTRPNILFLFADDQRFDTIGALGNAAIHTPNLDRLVARGTAFTHAHIPCGTSGAVCMPSRAMLHTGRSLFHLDGAGECIPSEHAVLGETLASAGYRTFGTGKWHNGRASYQRGFADGDEIFFGGMADHWNVPVYRYDPAGQYDARCRKCPDPFKSNATVEVEADHIHAGRHSSELIADTAIEFLNRDHGDCPFFLYAAFLAPHDPRTMPERFRVMYDPADVELPPNFAGGHAFDNGDLHVRDELLAGFPRTPRETRRHIAEYYAMISHLDEQVGRILDTLEARNMIQNTIIVYAGDNGLALGQHGLFGKQSCYEHSVRVPLLLAGPGIPAGERRDAFVYLFDLFATLCELTGTPVPDGVDGFSLVPALHDATVAVRESLYFAYCGLHRAVRDRRHKLVEYVVGGEHVMTQVFDLDADPWEQRNLAADGAHAATVARLRAELRRFADAWGDRDTKWGRQFWPVFDAAVGG